MSKSLKDMSHNELIEANEQLMNELESQRTSYESRIDQMQFQIDQLTRLMHGSKRERFVKNQDEQQLTLPFEVEPQDEPEKEKEVVTYVREKSKRRENHPGRMPLPSHLPVEETVIEPDCDTTGMKEIGQEVTDQLELVPGKLFIKRTIRPKYITPEDEEGNQKGIIANLPVMPIEKCMAGPGLLTQIMIDKFIDHLPIYRQIQRFKRDDVKLSSSTINGWQESICNLLEPLYDTLKHRVLSQGYLQADETPIRVIDKQKKGKTHQGYYWVYYSPLEKVVLFDYRHGRGREGPTEILEGFKGYLQTDGYKAYDSFAEEDDITLLNCMAHARRYFEKALDYDKDRAEYAMEKFQQLYAIERKAVENNFSPEQRKELRLDESLPILNELGKWMAETYKHVLPESPIGKAFNYCIPRWDNLNGYLYDGSLEIDNNLTENAIRPVALGRKNYLFAGSERGAHRAAMMYSFFGTCKKNNVNPFDWLKKVLEVIPEYKVNKLDELLPQNLEL